MSAYLVPCLLGLAILLAMLRGTDAFSSFVQGAKDGVRTLIAVAPSLCAMLVVIGMLRASGVLEALTAACAPVLTACGLPAEVLPLAFIKPLSGAGSLAALEDVLASAGPDSMAGRAASVMMGASETVFYTLAVYFGAAGVKKMRYALFAALCASFAGTLASGVVCRFFFAG